MAGTHLISSSLFIQSGSIAKFKSGITSSNLNIKGAIYAQEFQGIGTDTPSDPLLTVGNPICRWNF